MGGQSLLSFPGKSPFCSLPLRVMGWGRWGVAGAGVGVGRQPELEGRQLFRPRHGRWAHLSQTGCGSFLWWAWLWFLGHRGPWRGCSGLQRRGVGRTRARPHPCPSYSRCLPWRRVGVVLGPGGRPTLPHSAGAGACPPQGGCAEEMSPRVPTAPMAARAGPGRPGLSLPRPSSHVGTGSREPLTERVLLAEEVRPACLEMSGCGAAGTPHPHPHCPAPTG